MSKEQIVWEILKQTGVLEAAAKKAGVKSQLETKEAETLSKIHKEQDFIIKEYNRVLKKLK